MISAEILTNGHKLGGQYQKRGLCRIQRFKWLVFAKRKSNWSILLFFWPSY